MINKLFIWVIFLISVGGTMAVQAAEPQSPKPHREPTLLLFVGEETDVLVIASRREESARSAPAISSVVSRADFLSPGDTTLAYVLDQQPGFYMAHKASGIQPFLRGVPDSFLTLYDTVPLGTEISKRNSLLGHEISLASTKRIEVMRGPGSVLWGPDAFAGIINVVPLSGKDLDGQEVGVIYGRPGDETGAYLNAGHDAGIWDGFLSVSGHRVHWDDTSANLAHFWGNESKVPIPPEEREGAVQPDDGLYLDVNGNFGYSDWLKLSGRFSDYRRPYALSNTENSWDWLESQGGSDAFVHFTAQRKMNYELKLTLSGYLSWLRNESEIVDYDYSSAEDTGYLEMLCDQTLFSGSGMLTTGISYRDRRVSRAPIWDSFPPDFFGPDNTFFLPNLVQKDYQANLLSVFGQYTHKFDDVDIWLGIRNDNHKTYPNRTSFNWGVVWSPTRAWMFKLLFGTAYRTPYAQQLLEGQSTALENIRSWNLQAAWYYAPDTGVTLTGFASRIKDHVLADPYAGLSKPNWQDIYGVELEGQWAVNDLLSFSMNGTALTNDGPDETYRYNDYIIVNSDASFERHYVDILYPFTTGPKLFGNLAATLHLKSDMALKTRLGYTGKQKFTFPTDEEVFSVPEFWSLDLGLTWDNVLTRGLSVELNALNVLDDSHKLPGTYKIIDAEGTTVQLTLRKRW